MDAPPAANAPKPCCVCDAPNGKHCTKCKSRHYCSKACQLVDWKRGHNKACRQLAAEFQDRLLDELMPEKKPKEEPPIVEDVAPADGSKFQDRLLDALMPEKLKITEAPAIFEDVLLAAARARALNDAKPDWRGTCAICLDLLPIDGESQRLYVCCCKTLCEECAYKCYQHDERCPLCRTPAPKSEAEAVRRMQTHVEKGNVEAQATLASSYYHGTLGLKQDLLRAFQLYELAAAQGQSQGQTALARCYERGDGVEMNLTTAALWYRRAAEQGLPFSQCRLGNMIFDGTGVAQSDDEALRWFRLAAAQGDAHALFFIARCHGLGRGVPQSFDEAQIYFERAAAKGHVEAAKRLEEFAAWERPQ